MFGRRIMGALGIAAALALGIVSPALADHGHNGKGNDNPTVSAPEIDASSGLAAIALLVGVLALVGERRKRPTVAG